MRLCVFIYKNLEGISNMTRVDYFRVLLLNDQVKTFKECFRKNSIITEHIIPSTGFTVVIIKRVEPNKIKLFLRLKNKGIHLPSLDYISHTHTPYDTLYNLFYLCNREIVYKNVHTFLSCNKTKTNKL